MEPLPVMPYAIAASGRRDADHLKLLTLFHYIVGALICMFASLFILHVVMGMWIVRGNGLFQVNPTSPNQPQFTALNGTTFSYSGTVPFQTPNNTGTPTWFGYIFIAFGLLAVIAGWSIGICTILSGRFIARRKFRLFSLIVAGFLCAWFPFGTVLGVFTLVVLLRESMKTIYNATTTAES